MSLHEGNIARYRLRPTEYQALLAAKLALTRLIAAEAAPTRLKPLVRG
jgi:hypothetical protein